METVRLNKYGNQSTQGLLYSDISDITATPTVTLAVCPHIKMASLILQTNSTYQNQEGANRNSRQLIGPISSKKDTTNSKIRVPSNRIEPVHNKTGLAVKLDQQTVKSDWQAIKLDRLAVKLDQQAVKLDQ